MIALGVLSLTCSSAETERSFKTYSWIHDSKRNRLTQDRAKKITYIAHNTKLLCKEPKPDLSDSESESDSELDSDADSERDLIFAFIS